MTFEPLSVPVQAEQQLPVHTIDQGATQPAPSEEQQQVSDTVFSREEQEAVAALMAAQMGLGLLHNLALETFSKPAEPEQPRRKKPHEDEK
ncbi:MAG: hypothetical protein AB7V46_16045 [Thermomicrobiales bacterium]